MSVAFQKKCRTEVLHEIKYSPCGKYLAVGSNENYVDVFDTSNNKKLGSCSGHSSFITHLDWSNDSQFIQTNSGDGERLIFKVPSICFISLFDLIDFFLMHLRLGKLVSNQQINL